MIYFIDDASANVWDIEFDPVAPSGEVGAGLVGIDHIAQTMNYEEMLTWFFKVHDPTTKDRQGNDVGYSYRSAIFYADDAQKKVAEAYIAQLDAAKLFGAPIVTTLEKLDKFYPAEAYHQDFVARNPNHGYVRSQSMPKILKVRERFKDILTAAGTDYSPAWYAGPGWNSRSIGGFTSGLSSSLSGAISSSSTAPGSSSGGGGHGSSGGGGGGGGGGGW